MSLILLLIPPAPGNLVISVDHRQRALADGMRPRPALVRFQPGKRDAAAAHSNRVEQIALDRLLVGQAGGPRDHLARRVVGDILVRPARARRAGRVELRQARAKQAWVLPFLELIVVRVAIKAEPVREEVANRRSIFVAGRQLEVRRVIGDRCLEIDLALLGKLRDHRRRDALRHRCPAEHRLRSHRITGPGERLAIALQEGDAPVLDDADGKPDHRRLGHQLAEAGVEQAVIDVAPRFGR